MPEHSNRMRKHRRNCKRLRTNRNRRTNRHRHLSHLGNTQTAAQLAASIYGTQASVAENASDNATTEATAANAEISNQNVYAMQESELEDQINSGVVENANNNATAVAGAQIAAGVTDLGLGDALTLAQQQENDAYNLTSQNDSAYDSEIPYIVENAGDEKNSLIDATDQTSLFQTVLSQGNPTVAAAGTGASASADSNANATTAAQTTSIASSLIRLLPDCLVIASVLDCHIQ